MREREEEEIVLRHVERQSLLEAEHRRKGKSRVVVTQATQAREQEDEELQTVLALNLRENEYVGRRCSGESVCPESMT